MATYSMLARHTGFRSRNGLWSINPDTFGLMILDEAHHLQGGTTQNALRTHFSHAAQLGFTATPDYDEERQLKNILPDKIHEITTTEAVDFRLISPYTTALLATPADLSHVRITGQEYDTSMLEEAINTNVRNIAVSKFVAENLAGKKLLFNTGSVAHAQALAETLRNHGIPALAVYGGQNKTEQAQILHAYHDGDIAALTQAKLLGEGYSEEGIEVVINVRPTLSRVREKQRTGRGQRIDPNNPDKALLVIECIDSGYRRKPVLYGHSHVTGQWQYAPSGLPGPLRASLDQAQSYHDGVTRLIADPDEIEEWYGGNLDIFAGHSATPVTLPAAKPVHTITEPGLLKGIEQAVEVSRTTGRPYRSPKQKAADHSTRQRQAGKIAERALDRYERFDEDGQPNSAHDMLGHFNSAEDGVARYILLGDEVPEGIGKTVVRSVLRRLAGTDEVKFDETVLARFRRLNLFVIGQSGVALDDISDETVKQSLTVVKLGRHTSIQGAHRPDNGNCAGIDPDLFFPERGASTREAKAVCFGCVAREGCLEHALANGEKFGIWGGTSERERRRLRRQRALQRRAVLKDNTGKEQTEDLEESEDL